MDFKGYTGEDLDSSLVFMSSDAYFASQALRSGLIGGATMKKLPLSNPSREAIEREIMKERIREEILAREMVERRILEEEVRREIEMERILEIRRLQMERWSGLAGTSGIVMHGDRQTQTIMPSWLEAGVAASLGRGIAQDGAEFAFRDRSSSHLLSKKTMAVMAQPAVRPESEKRSPSNEESSLSAVCEKVFDRCLAPSTAGGEGCDNMTMILVQFKKPIHSNATNTEQSSQPAREIEKNSNV
ncbi:hypothetical protein IEQ34_008999 [Dendrobium chrysotoxum]|uniref:Uncharacterized protein n=1 Tax=Dendrobium chrysotoxum TaxID=161865 RepID=A0AAV7H066_DENCH|nr:hypothetical protein IEQ34_008999 [Dendrobium chrysotoxum]